MSFNDLNSSRHSGAYANGHKNPSKGSSSFSDYTSALSANLYTLFLFTKSDIKTVILPTAAFAIANTLSGHFVTSSHPHSTHPASTTTPPPAPPSLTVLRLALTITWTWLGLLVETIANQRLQHSITEDSLNKPWRPIVSSRVSPPQARRLLITLIALFYALSVLLHVPGPGLALIVFTYIYNDLQGADDNPLVRNVLNACGLMSFGAGATIILATANTVPISLPWTRQPFATQQAPPTLTNLGWTWITVIGLMITTTVSTQDLADVIGDRKRNRRTLPLIWGAGPTRLYLAASVVLWNSVCVAFWRVGFWAALALVGVSGWLAVNLVTGTSLRADERSWRLWCAWVVTIYALPAVSGSQGLVRAAHVGV